MKQTVLLVVIACVALSANLFAALGDTEEEIASLFGIPVDQGVPDKKGITTNMYQKGNYIILVQFLNHLSLAESYTRADKQDFSDEELSALLDGNSNGRPWNKEPNKRAWERSDHKASAWCQTLSGRPTLLIQAR
jgi:hypothetical protein